MRPGSSGTRVTTRAGAFATGPGLIPASWVPLMALGVLAALAVQAILAGREHLSTGTALGISLAASLAGAAGARAWYVALNRGKVQGIPTQGLCIQGFIVAAVVVLIAGLALAGIPVRTFLDISAPGLFFGMAIGRQGCFLHGCCTGRPTASRWGIWASDGRMGARRAPTQQLESLACLVIGLAALLLVLQARPPAAGTVFIGAVAAYTVCRQLLFPLPRRAAEVLPRARRVDDRGRAGAHRRRHCRDPGLTTARSRLAVIRSSRNGHPPASATLPRPGPEPGVPPMPRCHAQCSTSRAERRARARQGIRNIIRNGGCGGLPGESESGCGLQAVTAGPPRSPRARAGCRLSRRTRPRRPGRGRRGCRWTGWPPVLPPRTGRR